MKVQMSPPTDVAKVNVTSRTPWIMLSAIGIVLLIVLLVVSLISPNLTERIKFFTVNFLSLCVLAVIAIQAYIYQKQRESMNEQLAEMRNLKGISDRQATTLDTHYEKMQGQLDAMKRQGDLMQQGLEETRALRVISERQATVFEGQAFTMQSQLDVMRNQVKLASEQIEAVAVAERAYLGIKNLNVEEWKIGSPVNLPFTIFNAGRTPAFEISMQSNAVISVKQPDWPAWGSDQQSGPMLCGGADRNVLNFTPWPVDQNSYAAIMSGTALLYVTIELRYLDWRQSHQRYRVRFVLNLERREWVRLREIYGSNENP